MAFIISDEQQSYADDQEKLDKLAVWVLGSPTNWADKCRKDIGVEKPISNPNKAIIKKMGGYLKLDIHRNVFARLVNGYLQDNPGETH